MGVSRRGRLWGLLGTLAVVSAVAFVAAGCGSSSPSSAASSSPSASSAPSVAVAGVPVTPDPALHQTLPASILTAGEIRVATTLPYPPWEMFVGNTTKVTGFECDLLEAVGVKLGVKVTFVNMAWASVILSLQGGKTDMIVGDMYDNTSREKQVTFVDYAYDGSSILVQKGNPQGITNLDSLAGKTVAVLSGSTQQVLLQNLNTQFKSSGKTPMQLIVLPDQPACLLAVKGGRAAADVSDHSTLEYIAMTTNNGATFEVLADPAAPKGYEPAVVGTAILKTNTQLVTAVQKAIQELINDGTYTTFIDKYHLIAVKSAEINVAGQAASASPTP